MLVSQQLTTTETAVYTAATAKTVKLSTCVLVNTSGGSINVWVSVVKTGGTAGDANRVLHSTAIAAGARLDLGSLGWLAPGDFVSAKASAATSVTLVLTGVAYGAATAGQLPGVQLATTGAGNRVTTGTTCSWTHTIGTGSNRYVVVPFMLSHTSWIDYFDWDVLTAVSNVDGALTRLASAMIGNTGQRTGSVHLFGRANPTSGAQTFTITASDASNSLVQLTGNSLSYTGVSGTSGALAQNSANTALSLTITSAADNRAVMAAAIDSGLGTFADAPGTIRYLNGVDVNSSADRLWVADAPGAATVAFTSSNSGGAHAEVGINLVAA